MSVGVVSFRFVSCIPSIHSLFLYSLLFFSFFFVSFFFLLPSALADSFSRYFCQCFWVIGDGWL